MQYLKQHFINQIRNCQREFLNGEAGRFYNDEEHIEPRYVLRTVRRWMRVPVEEIIRGYLIDQYNQYVADHIDNADLDDVDMIARNLRAEVVLMRFVERHRREYDEAASDEDMGEHDALEDVHLGEN